MQKRPVTRAASVGGAQKRAYARDFGGLGSASGTVPEPPNGSGRGMRVPVKVTLRTAETSIASAAPHALQNPALQQTPLQVVPDVDGV